MYGRNPRPAFALVKGLADGVRLTHALGLCVLRQSRVCGLWPGWGADPQGKLPHQFSSVQVSSGVKLSAAQQPDTLHRHNLAARSQLWTTRVRRGQRAWPQRTLIADERNRSTKHDETLTRREVIGTQPRWSGSSTCPWASP